MSSKLDAEWLDLCSHVSPQSLQAWLRSRGWALVEDRAARHGIVGWRKADRFVPIPVRLDDLDFMRNMVSALERVALAEDISPTSLARDLIRPQGDRIAFRIASDATAKRSLPFEQALSLRQHAWTLLLASAHSSMSRRPYYPRLSSPSAVQLMRQAQELPAEGGSFVTQVVLPLQADADQMELPETSIGRRTTETLLKALHKVQFVRTRGGLDELAECSRDGVSGNLLNALSGLGSLSTNARVGVSVAWSMQTNIPQLDAAPQIEFLPEQLEGLDRVAARMTATEPSPGTEIVGHVLLVTRDARAKKGTVVIVPERDATLDRLVSRVSMEFPAAIYQRLVSAHLADQKVKVTGTLRRDGRSWHMEQPVLVEVLLP